jgi:hypothetical protein
MNRPRRRRIALAGVASGAGLLAVYLRLIRPWTMRWGATDEEVTRPLPGDQLTTRPGSARPGDHHRCPSRAHLAMAGAAGQRPGRLVRHRPDRQRRGAQRPGNSS